MLFYDYLITFFSEVCSISLHLQCESSQTNSSCRQVEYIWKSPWTLVKAGFLLNRYGNLVGQTVITFQEIGFFGPGSQQVRIVFFFTSSL